MMILRPWQAIALAALALVVLVMAWPRQDDLVELQMRAGSIDAAIEVLERELVRQPESPKARRELGKAYERAGRLEPALKLLEDAARTRVLAPDERARGKRLALAVGEPARALAIVTAPGQAAPAAWELDGLVDLALQAGDLPAARRWQAALAMEHPDDQRALARLRDLALAGSDLEAGIIAQRRIVAAGGGRTASNRLADLLLQRGEPLKAYEALAGLPAPIDSARRPWFDRLARLAEWSKRPDLAMPHLQAAYDAAPDPALGARLLAAAYAKPGVESVALAKAVRAKFPADVTIAKTARAVLIASGQADAVLVDLQAAVQAAPRDAATHEELVTFAEWRQRRDVALAELGRWAEVQGRGPAGFPARAKRATVLGWEKRMDEARAEWTALLADATGDVAPGTERSWRLTLLGITPITEDLTPAGRQNLVKLALLASERLDVRRRLAEAALEVGDRDLALATQQSLIKLPGSTPADALELARWLDWFGKPGESFTMLRRVDAREALKPDRLVEAAYRATELESWNEASHFFARAAHDRPKDDKAWVGLARVQAVRGDLPASSRAWTRRLALRGVTTSIRLQAAQVLARQARFREAVNLLKAAGDKADPVLLRERISMAYELGDRVEQEAAIRAVLRTSPDEVELLDALAGLRLAAGAEAEADTLWQRALRQAPNDARIVARLAARQLELGQINAAQGLVEHLEQIGPADADGWQVLASFWGERDPARAIAALDQLHARGGGDAGTWLRRAELADVRHDGDGARRSAETALAKAEAALAARGADPAAAPLALDPTLSDAAQRVYELHTVRARALALLGRPQAAEAAWRDAHARFPERVEPTVAMARLRLEARDFVSARGLATEARRLSPQHFEARLLLADVAAAQQDWAPAAEAFGRLAIERPRLTFLAAQEADARFRLGQYGRARAGLRAAIERNPRDNNLREAYRGFRDDGTSGARPFAELERSPVGNLTGGGTTADWRVDDAWRLNADLATRRWDDGASLATSAEELGLGARFRRPGVDATLRGGLLRQDAAGPEPVGEAKAAFDTGVLRGQVLGSHGRWAESARAIAARGRETRAEADLAWRPDPRVELRAIGEAGRIAVETAPAGVAAGVTGSASLKPAADSPFTAYWFYRQRWWGDTGAMVGLPSEVRFHTLLLGWASRWGAWRWELQPGWAIDAMLGQGTPTGAATLAVELGPDFEASVSGNASGSAFDVGGGGSYQRLDTALAWRF